MTDKPKSSLYLRVVSGVVLAPLVIYALVGGVIPFMIFIVIALGLSLYEWGRMARGLSHPLIAGLVGIVYLLLCFAAFVYVHLHFGAGHTLALMLTIWAADSGAYFAGKTIGGPKLAPGISPNKTWAGLGGALLAGGVTMLLYAVFVGSFLSVALGQVLNLFPLVMAIPVFLIGAGVALVGQVGDLIESAQKRNSGVKDSGNLIPGHGGILDRIDGLLLAAPFFLIILVVASE